MDGNNFDEALRRYEAIGYYISSNWIWTGTEDALEWLFYKKQELRK